MNAQLNYDAEVVDIEKHHALVQKIMDDAAEIPSTNKGQLLVQSHQNVATLLRKLRQAPAAQMVADRERLTSFFAKRFKNGFAASYADELLSSGVVKQMPGECELEEIMHKWFKGSPKDREISLAEFVIKALFRAPDEVKREGS